MSDQNEQNKFHAKDLKAEVDEQANRTRVDFKMSVKEALRFLLIFRSDQYRQAAIEGNKPEYLPTVEALARAGKVIKDHVNTLEFKIAPDGDVIYKSTLKLQEGQSEEEIGQIVKEALGNRHVMDFIKSEFIKANKEEKAKPKKAKKAKGDEQPGFTPQAMHLIKQFFGTVNPAKQLPLFVEQIEQYVSETGLPLRNRPEGLGLTLNDCQMRVFQGILKAFADTNYQGEYQVEHAESLDYDAEKVRTGGASMYNNAYRNVPKIPVRRLTPAEIVRLAGYDIYRQGDKEEVKQATEHLGTTQYCFYWNRLAFNRDGKPEFNKDGTWKKEEVMEVGTVFRMKEVRDEQQRLKYYEIHPSAVMLDQVNERFGGNYFMLVPHQWQEDVRKQIGKRAGRYTYLFLYWLRYKAEEIRRYNSNRGHKNKKAFVIRMGWRSIAQVLKMPESLYIRNWKTALQKIEQAYEVALKMGYLTRYERVAAVDVLHLNEAFFPQPGLPAGEPEQPKLDGKR